MIENKNIVLRFVYIFILNISCTNHAMEEKREETKVYVRLPSAEIIRYRLSAQPLGLENVVQATGIHTELGNKEMAVGHLITYINGIKNNMDLLQEDKEAIKSKRAEIIWSLLRDSQEAVKQAKELGAINESRREQQQYFLNTPMAEELRRRRESQERLQALVRQQLLMDAEPRNN